MTWAEIVEKIQDVSDRFRTDASEPWFRGHRCASFHLNSSLHRYVERLTTGWINPPTGQAYVSTLREEFKTLYRRFHSEAWPLLDAQARSDWGVVFTMQHYGLPTRLLDWTESFGCALLFAQMGRKRGDAAAIWVLDPQALNRLSIGHAGFLVLADDMSEANLSSRDWHPKYVAPTSNLRSVAGAPLFTNPRMTAQRAAFTIAGDSPLPLDQEFPELVSAGHLLKIDLPPETYDDANNFLQLAGLTAFSFYPDLHGLALRHKADAERRMADFRRFVPEAFIS